MYFSSFPLILYDMKGDQKSKLATNIIKRVKVREKVLDAAMLYQKYFVQPGERPEDVAFNHFGKSEYHWIILLTNNIVDAYYDWPMNYNEFETFIKDKYANGEAIHHYEKKQTSGDTEIHIECMSTDAGAVSISNREYEEREQDKKRQIQLLDKSLLNDFITEFDKLISE